MITRQKVSAALRAAGIEAAKFTRSRMVRGWGDWSSGVRVREIDDEIHVHWTFGRWSKPTADYLEDCQQNVRAALDRKGIRYALEGDLSDWVIRIKRGGE